MGDCMIVSKCCDSQIEVVYGDGSGIICRSCAKLLDKDTVRTVPDEYEESGFIYPDEVYDIRDQRNSCRDFANRDSFLTPGVTWSKRAEDIVVSIVWGLAWFGLFVLILLLSAMFSEPVMRTTPTVGVYE